MTKLLYMLALIACIIATAFVVSYIESCDKEQTPPLQTPAKADTIYVAQTDTAALREMRDDLRDMESRITKRIAKQTANLITQHVYTEPVAVQRVAPLWYVRAIEVAKKEGDLTHVVSSKYSYDASGQLQRQDAFTDYHTVGPLRGLVADSNGVRLDFDQYEPPRVSFLDKVWNCGFECDLAKIGGGFLGGVVLAK